MPVAKIIRAAVEAWDLVSDRLGLIASTFAITMALVVSAEVVARGLFQRSTYVVYDVAEFLFAGMIFLGLAETHRSQAHIRMNLAISRLPSSVRKLVQEIVLPFITLVYLVFLFIQAVLSLISSYQAGTKTVSVVELILWPAQISMPVGLLTFAVLVFLYFVHGCWSALSERGKSPPGPSSNMDEGG